MLSIFGKRDGRRFAHLNFTAMASKNPLEYVNHLDKTNQIKALMFSNNHTVNLAETMESHRIAAILKSTAQTSYYAHILNTKNFRRFSSLFSKDIGLQHLKIKKFTSRNKEKEFFVARLKTLRNNSISVRGCTIPALMACLSDKTVRDLMAAEFGCPQASAAQTLLIASSKLATISRILDVGFIPEDKLVKSARIQDAQNQNTSPNMHEKYNA